MLGEARPKTSTSGEKGGEGRRGKEGRKGVSGVQSPFIKPFLGAKDHLETTFGLDGDPSVQ